jgi:hypothetical protein
MLGIMSRRIRETNVQLRRLSAAQTEVLGYREVRVDDPRGANVGPEPGCVAKDLGRRHRIGGIADPGRGRMVGGRQQVALPAKLGLVGHHGHDDGGHGTNAPGPDPPQRAAVEIVFLGQ